MQILVYGAKLAPPYCQLSLMVPAVERQHMGLSSWKHTQAWV